MQVLGIETSCDETGIALYDTDNGQLHHRLYSQVDIHVEYGGVVPELASRDHIRKVLPLINEVLKAAKINKDQIDGIAYTSGPGLIGALLVGASIARSLAYALNIPAIGVHHMEGHLLAPMLCDHAPEFPFVALLVSGGHTQLMEVKGIGEYELLGQTLDDAVGEAFDKTAKLLNLGYPGGPALAKLAEQGDNTRFKFPRPMVDRPGMDFSFSGLKTFAINTIAKHGDDAQTKADAARAFEEAVVATLMIKCRRALDHTGYKRLVVAGGVSANVRLRCALNELMQSRQGQAYFPPQEFCTDNGAMIAYAGAQRLLAGQQDSDLTINARARWPMEELNIAERQINIKTED